MAALLGLFWRLLREGRLKVARGRSWQPEIGMEHASRGRRSGNKGVGARWRGRFRIFSARHCSRTKVSHAENSGMTMLFFSLEVAPVSEGDSFTRYGPARHACRRWSGSTRSFNFFVLGDSFTRSGETAPRPAAGQARINAPERAGGSHLPRKLWRKSASGVESRPQWIFPPQVPRFCRLRRREHERRLAGGARRRHARGVRRAMQLHSRPRRRPV